MKKITFLGDSLKRLKAFPNEARLEAGYNLYLIQRGEIPVDFKPMQAVGPGVYEIRIKGDDGSFRVFYVANLPEAVFVLHAFQKKSRATSKKDMALGRERYRALPGGERNG